MEDRNGIILGYNVYHNEKGQAEVYSQKTTVTNTIIKGLKPYTEYCTRVEGFTSIGASPKESCLYVRTLDSGTPSQFDSFCSIKKLLIVLLAVQGNTVFFRMNGVTSVYMYIYVLYGRSVSQ